MLIKVNVVSGNEDIYLFTYTVVAGTLVSLDGECNIIESLC